VFAAVVVKGSTTYADARGRISARAMIFKRIELNISAVGVPQKKGKMMSAGKTRLGWKKNWH
jgi:hypothetical protein